jgi:hypothetical protein
MALAISPVLPGKADILAVEMKSAMALYKVTEGLTGSW